ncbi:cohesin domain-containing protein [Paenibacillus sp. UMB4589-SE434]|uniref:cohesin domain-containing protein n=1 Tax=Paenibacillus sp. UMB4589-SE434 TaxID=3046314 RepID=UPI00254DA306|nr:cohesin domain-containing protein [Paenibacillus sp. UMB4589-SE434]MDK8179764.1 cohesin domain-containing protein [Paenibacillus sp. UMB4589-SE434]
MKKYLLSLAFLLVFVVMIPQQGYAAVDYKGGVLDGVHVYLSSSESVAGAPLAAATDNDESTVISMTGRNVGGDKDHIVKTFMEPVTVNAIRVSATKSINFGFYDKSGKYITVNNKTLNKISADEADGRLIEFPQTSGIYKVILFNDLKDPVDIKEFNIYNGTIEAPILTADAGVKVVDLNWGSVASSVGFNIERSTVPGGPYEKIATSVTGTTYSDQNVVNGTTYYYVVTALNHKGEGQRSNEASATPKASAVTLDIESAKDKVFLNETFTVQAVLKNATNIYAEDFNVQYDKTRFQLVSVTAADHMGLFHKGNVSDDTIRLITASLGKEHGINGNGTLVNFTFKAIGLGKGKVDATRGKIADNGTTETTLAEENCGEKEIEVIGGEFTLKHLGLLGFNYNQDKNNLTDELKTFLGSTGNVVDIDLVDLTNAILANPNYDFN